MAGEIRSLFLPGPVGRLEALLNTGSPRPTYAALLCHPHPLHGGTMHNKVVYNAMKALNGLGLPVLRFNFRGAGLSEGTHDHGQGEIEDVRACLDWLENKFKLPIVFTGFSFGAAVGLRASCSDSRVTHVIALGTPVKVEGRLYTYDFLQHCAKPKLFVSGAHDPFGPLSELQKLVSTAAAPKKLVVIEGAGHFFEQKLDPMRQVIEHWLRDQLLRAAPQ